MSDKLRKRGISEPINNLGDPEPIYLPLPLLRGQNKHESEPFTIDNKMPDIENNDIMTGSSVMGHTQGQGDALPSIEGAEMEASTDKGVATATATNIVDNRRPARRSARAVVPNRFFSTESDDDLDDQDGETFDCQDCGAHYANPRSLHNHRRVRHGSPNRRPGGVRHSGVRMKARQHSNVAEPVKAKGKLFCPNAHCERHESFNPAKPFRSDYHKESHLLRCNSNSKNTPGGAEGNGTPGLTIAPETGDMDTTTRSVNVSGEAVGDVKQDVQNKAPDDNGKGNGILTIANGSAQPAVESNQKKRARSGTDMREPPSSKHARFDDNISIHKTTNSGDVWRDTKVKSLKAQAQTWTKKLAATENEVQVCKDKLFRIETAISVLMDDI